MSSGDEKPRIFETGVKLAWVAEWQMSILNASITLYRIVYRLHAHDMRSLAIGIPTHKMSSWPSSDWDKCGKHLVHITHFFNPHHFWYKYADAKLSNLDELNELEAKIHEYATNHRHDKNVFWRIGDIVATYSITWNKWVRGRVENVIESDNGTPRYSLWAIDCGLPVNAIGRYMAPLPKELAESSVCAVHEGCIYGTMPAKQVCLDFPFVFCFCFSFAS